jgi:hypothetical protein
MPRKNHTILEDPVFAICINLADMSQSINRYGSIAVSREERTIPLHEAIKGCQLDELIGAEGLSLPSEYEIGTGFNRCLVHPDWPFRIMQDISIGYDSHGEISAINNLLMTTERRIVTDVYVGSYFQKPGNGFKKDTLFLRSEPYFTCVNCSKQFVELEVENIWSPSEQGWNHMTSESSYASSLEFKNGSKESLNSKRYKFISTHETRERLPRLSPEDLGYYPIELETLSGRKITQFFNRGMEKHIVYKEL